VLSSVTALAVLLLIFGALALTPVSSPRIAERAAYQPPRHVAQLVNLANVVWTNPRDAWQRDALIFLGDEIEIKQGVVELEYASGAVVVLEGPAHFIIKNTNAGSLEIGKLLAEVSPSAVGFAIATPQAKVVDLGTKFGLVVDGEGTTQAHVFTGEVEFTAHGSDVAGTPRTLLLTAGEGVVANPQGNVQRQPPAVAPQFVQRLPRPESTDSTLSQSLLQYRPRVKATARADLTATVGTLFVVGAEPLELTHLGVQDVDAAADAQDRDGADNLTGFADDDGFHKSPISVGIWNADDGQLLASAEVTSEHPLIGSWRYAELTDKRVVLTPQGRYIIGAQVGGGIEWFLDLGMEDNSPPFVRSLRVQLLENRYTTSGFAFPQQVGPGQVGRWGPANALFQQAPVVSVNPAPQ
jgi:hypothetical protein